MALSERDEQDIRWFLCDASGELSGVHSANMEPVIGPSTMQRDYDPSVRQMRARGRERRLSEIFDRLARMHRMVLALVYGQRIPSADYDLYGETAALIEFTDAVGPTGNVEGLSLQTELDARREARAALAAAQVAYATTRSDVDAELKRVA